MTLAGRRSSAFALFVAAAIGLGAAGCSAAVDVHTIRSPSAPFERYHTIAFLPRAAAPARFETSPRSAEVRQEIAATAAQILLAHGYALAPLDDADLVFRIEAGRRERPLSTTSPHVPSGSPATASGPGQGLAGGEPMEGGSPKDFIGELDREDNELTQGAFVIDAFDRRTRAIVWHGSARTDVRPDAIDHAKLRGAVDKVLATFPAAR